MRPLLSATGGLLLFTSLAQAGGIDRSGQSIAPIFEKGNYVELSFGLVEPSVSGIFTHPLAGALKSGNVAPSYSQVGFAAKMDLSDKMSMGIILDSPYGANVAYVTHGYPLNDTNAEVKTESITVLGRYKFDDSISIHAGVRQVTASGHYDPTGPYASTYAAGSDVGYLIGGAYEKPEIALRVALTYASATEFALDGTTGDLSAKMPQSVNLDFQTGIAAETLLFGSIRWADWTSATIDDSLAGNLVDYTSDTMTYTVGVGRKFWDSFSGALTVGYEKAEGVAKSNLSPTDGTFNIGVGGTYTQGNMKISGGVRYIKPGDATTEASGPFPGGSRFADNSAVAIGVKVSFSF